MSKIFVASPLGFAESTRPFIEQLRIQLNSIGLEMVDPWSASGGLDSSLDNALMISDSLERVCELHRLSMLIAERNAELLKSCDGVLSILDGVDVDSGTASEIGYAFGLGNKVINGYRGDFRRSGENEGVMVNLQVQYWIERSGGKIINSLKEIKLLSFTR